MSAEELRAFSKTLLASGDSVAAEAEKVILKGAMNLKKDLQSQMSRSRHFKGITSSITFDHDGLTAEVGPEKGAGSGGALANIAYFGSSRGGGTVEAPEEALAREMPNLEKYLLEAVVKGFS